MPVERLAGNDEATPLVKTAFTYTVAVSKTSGIIGSILNPFGKAAIIHQATIDVTTPSSGASTMDLGVAADAVTGADNLIDGASGASAAALNSVKNAGSNGTSVRKWGATQYVNLNVASGDVNGIALTVYLLVSFP